MKFSSEFNPKKTPDRPSCGKCQNGLLLAVVKVFNAHPYAYKCNCDLGNTLDLNLPRWIPEMEFRNEVISIQNEDTKKFPHPWYT